MIEGIIFDLGGTLIHFDAPVPEVFAEADLVLYTDLRAAGLNLDRERFLQTFRGEMDAFYQERASEFIEYTTLYVIQTLLAGWGYTDLPQELLKQAIRRMFAVTQQHWQPEEDTIETLEVLRSQEYRLGLISNAADAEDVHVLVEKNGLKPFLDPVLTSAEIGVRKPNPLIFHKLLNHWGIQPQKAAMVGDTLGADILGARNAGVRSIWITRRASTPANLAHADTIHPDSTIETLRELPELLKRMALI